MRRLSYFQEETLKYATEMAQQGWELRGWSGMSDKRVCRNPQQKTPGHLKADGVINHSLVLRKYKKRQVDSAVPQAWPPDCGCDMSSLLIWRARTHLSLSV